MSCGLHSSLLNVALSHCAAVALPLHLHVVLLLVVLRVVQLSAVLLMFKWVTACCGSQLCGLHHCNAAKWRHTHTRQMQHSLGIEGILVHVFAGFSAANSCRGTCRLSCTTRKTTSSKTTVFPWVSAVSTTGHCYFATLHAHDTTCLAGSAAPPAPVWACRQQLGKPQVTRQPPSLLLAVQQSHWRTRLVGGSLFVAGKGCPSGRLSA